MELERERALTLAHEEAKAGCSTPEEVIRRAELYLHFLRGTRPEEPVKASSEDGPRGF